MKTIFKNQIFVGVMIILLAGAIGGLATIGFSVYIDTKYNIPAIHKDLKDKDLKLERNINLNKKEIVLLDSSVSKRNSVQNKFIFENRTLINYIIKSDSLINNELKNISLSLTVILKNNKQAAKELKKLKELLGTSNYVEKY